ncbi:MAG: STAS domain-containing protein [Candidatus Electryonea clarkiae]|nr:STAS domain-containing protein [Candidatus Electryonea clarkiae]MDP8286324.1 STAS domain-containing protein [Candidatus Electryonea clarkiae]
MEKTEILSIKLTGENEHLLSGRIDSESLDILKDYLDELDGEVSLNMSEVKYINSAGLGIILAADRRMKKNKGSIIIVHPSGFVSEIFKISGLDNIIEVSL